MDVSSTLRSDPHSPSLVLGSSKKMLLELRMQMTRVTELEVELHRAREDLQFSKLDLESANGRVSELENEVVQLREQVLQCQSSESSLESSKLTALTSERDTACDLASRRASELEEARTTASRRASELEEARTTACRAAARASKLEEELDIFRQAAEQAKADARQAAEQARAELRSVRQAAEQATADARQAAEEARAELRSVRQAEQATADARQAAEQARAELRSVRQAAEQATADARQAAEQARAELRSSTQHVDRLLRMQSTMSAEVEALQFKLSESIAAREELSRQYSALISANTAFSVNSMATDLQVDMLSSLFSLYHEQHDAALDALLVFSRGVHHACNATIAAQREEIARLMRAAAASVAAAEALDTLSMPCRSCGASVAPPAHSGHGGPLSLSPDGTLSSPAGPRFRRQPLCWFCSTRPTVNVGTDPSPVHITAAAVQTSTAPPVNCAVQVATLVPEDVLSLTRSLLLREAELKEVKLALQKANDAITAERIASSSQLDALRSQLDRASAVCAGKERSLAESEQHYATERAGLQHLLELLAEQTAMLSQEAYSGRISEEQLSVIGSLLADTEKRLAETEGNMALSERRVVELLAVNAQLRLEADTSTSQHNSALLALQEEVNRLNKAHSQETVELQSCLRQQQSDLVRAHDTITASSEKIDRASETIIRLQKDLEEAYAQVSTVTEDRNAAINRCEEENMSLTEECARLVELLEAAQQRVKDDKWEIEQVKRDADATQCRLDDSNKTICDLRERLSVLRDADFQLRRQQKLAETAEWEKAEMVQRLEELQRELRQQQEAFREQKTEMAQRLEEQRQEALRQAEAFREQEAAMAQRLEGLKRELLQQQESFREQEAATAQRLEGLKRESRQQHEAFREQEAAMAQRLEEQRQEALRQAEAFREQEAAMVQRLEEQRQEALRQAEAFREQEAAMAQRLEGLKRELRQQQVEMQEVFQHRRSSGDDTPLGDAHYPLAESTPRHMPQVSTSMLNASHSSLHSMPRPSRMTDPLSSSARRRSPVRWPSYMADSTIVAQAALPGSLHASDRARSGTALRSSASTVSASVSPDSTKPAVSAAAASIFASQDPDVLREASLLATSLFGNDLLGLLS